MAYFRIHAVAPHRKAEINRLRKDWLALLRSLDTPGFNDGLQIARRRRRLSKTMRKRYSTDQQVRNELGGDGIAKLRDRIEAIAKKEYRARVSESELGKQFDWEVTCRRRRRPSKPEYREAREAFVRAAAAEETERACLHVDYHLDSALLQRGFHQARAHLSPMRRLVVDSALEATCQRLPSPSEIELARKKRDEIARAYEELTPAERRHFHKWTKCKTRTCPRQLPRRPSTSRLDASAPYIPAPRAMPHYALRGHVLDQHALDLERSTVSEAQWVDAGIFSECQNVMLHAIMGREESSEALVFPYFRAGRESAELLRIKRMRGGRGYSGPEGRQTGIYFPPEMLVDGGAPLKDRSRVLLWVEGEKKALALARMGYSVLGLPGVWNAADVPHREATKKLRLHEWIRSDVAVADREHLIVFDPDIRHNVNVQRAQRRLAGMLWRAGATSVWAVEWPNDLAPWVNGIDDYANSEGDDAAHELIVNAVPLLTGSVTIPASVLKDTRISAPTKVTYGALFAAANRRGMITRLTLGDLGATTERSPGAVSDAIERLIEVGYVTRARGKRERCGESWSAEPDAYRLNLFGAHRGEPLVHVNAALMSSHEQAVAHAALPGDGTPMRTVTLAKLIGTKARALRYTLEHLDAAGHITRGHGTAARRQNRR
jgi:hypothetical protein